jgi:hypothetical protein
MTTPRATDAPAIEIDAALADLVEGFIDRLNDGEPVDPREFAAEHPEHAELLRELLPAASTMAGLRRSALRDASPASPPRLGSDVLGGYRIVREIGRGGMGVVYEAERASDGRRVALKVLSFSPGADPRRIERFRIEGRAAAALDHPHIVPVFEIGRDETVHYYAMQLVEGCSLAAVIRGERAGLPSVLGPREAARLALQAAEALAHAHSLGVVHRDVKPANLLLDPGGHLWVADFGLARFLDGDDLTLTGDVMGTLRYLSPEQAEGRGMLDPRTDVYGLGATLYELTTLRRAFDGQGREDLIRRIARDEPIAPRRIDPTIPRDLETIVSKAMAKGADDRYSTAAEFAEDLRRFLDGGPILARRPGPSRRVARWARRNRAAVTIATVVLALFLIGTGAGLALVWREQVRTSEILRVALTTLDEFCLSTSSAEFTRDPTRAQEVQDLQIRALAIYERKLLGAPGDYETRWAAARAEHRVANILARSPRAAEAEPAFVAAHGHMRLLLANEPGQFEFREELADILGDWGASRPAGGPETSRLRRQALAEHASLARRVPYRARNQRAESRDCIEVARTLGITDPAEAAEKEALFRRAAAIRLGIDDHGFESTAERAEALAYLGHLLNATGRTAEGGVVMAEGRSLMASLGDLSAGDPLRRHRVVTLQSLFILPRYCNPSPVPAEELQIYRQAVDGKARLVSEFPLIPEFRAGLAWANFCLSNKLESFGRAAEAEAEANRAAELLDVLSRDHPTIVHYRRWHTLAIRALGRIRAASERTNGAQPQARRAVDVPAESAPARMRVARKPMSGDRENLASGP